MRSFRRESCVLRLAKRRRPYTAQLTENVVTNLQYQIDKLGDRVDKGLALDNNGNIVTGTGSVVDLSKNEQVGGVVVDGQGYKFLLTPETEYYCDRPLNEGSSIAPSNTNSIFANSAPWYNSAVYSHNFFLKLNYFSSSSPTANLIVYKTPYGVADEQLLTYTTTYSNRSASIVMVGMDNFIIQTEENTTYATKGFYIGKISTKNVQPVFTSGVVRSTNVFAYCENSMLYVVATPRYQYNGFITKVDMNTLTKTTVVGALAGPSSDESWNHALVEQYYIRTNKNGTGIEVAIWDVRTGTASNVVIPNMADNGTSINSLYLHPLYVSSSGKCFFVITWSQSNNKMAYVKCEYFSGSITYFGRTTTSIASTTSNFLIRYCGHYQGKALLWGYYPSMQGAVYLVNMDSSGWPISKTITLTSSSSYMDQDNRIYLGLRKFKQRTLNKYSLDRSGHLVDVKKLVENGFPGNRLVVNTPVVTVASQTPIPIYSTGDATSNAIFECIDGGLLLTWSGHNGKRVAPLTLNKGIDDMGDFLYRIPYGVRPK